jgi:hypothetical protein
MSNTYAIVSALIFALVAIAHLLRIIKQWTVVIGQRWSRLSEQNFRVAKWSLCRG